MNRELYRAVVLAYPLTSSVIYDTCMSGAITCIFGANEDYVPARASVLRTIRDEGWRPYDIDGESPAWPTTGARDRAYARLRREAIRQGSSLSFFCLTRWSRGPAMSPTALRRALVEDAPRTFYVVRREEALASITSKAGVRFTPVWRDQADALAWSKTRRGHRVRALRRDATVELFRSIGDSDGGVALGARTSLVGYDGHDLADAITGLDHTSRFGIDRAG